MPHRTRLPIALGLSLSISVAAFAEAPPVPLVPADLDLSGTWYLDPHPTPVYTEVPQRCDYRFQRSTNYPMYGESWVELHRTGSRYERRGIGMDWHLIDDYEGRIHYLQAYAHDDQRSPNLNYGCGSEAAEYKVTGTLEWDLADSIQFGMSGPLDSPVRYMHSNSASFGGVFADPEGTLIYGGFNAAPWLANETSQYFTNIHVYPPGCETWLNNDYYSYSLTQCRPMELASYYLRRSGAAKSLTAKLAPHIFDTRTSTAFVGAQLTVFEQPKALREKMSGESDRDYSAYLHQALSSATVVASAAVGPDGRAAFDLPVWKGGGASPHLERRLYAMVMTSADGAVDLGGQSAPLYYADRSIPNIKVPAAPDVPLVSIDYPAQKIAIAEQLITECPVSYGPVETQVKQFIEAQLAAGTPSDAVLEGIRRGIWAERTDLSAVQSARSFVSGGLEALVNLLIEVIKMGLGQIKHNKDLGEAADKVKELTSDRIQLAVNKGFSGAAGVTDADLSRAAAAVLQNNSAAGLILWRWLKSISTLVQTGVRDAMLFAGVEADDAREWASWIADLVLAIGEVCATKDPTELAGVIGKSLFGHYKDAIVNRLIDGSGPTYCDNTRPSLELTRDQLTTWNRADPVAASAAIDDVYHRALVPVQDVGVNGLIAMAYMRAVADSAGSIKDVFEFIPLPQAQTVAKGAMLTQLATEFTDFASLMVAAFVNLPGHVKDASEFAYGLHMARDILDLPGPRIPLRPALLTELSTAMGRVDAGVRRVTTQLNTDQLAAIVADLASTDPDRNLALAVGNLKDATARVELAAQGVREDGNNLHDWLARMSNSEYLLEVDASAAMSQILRTIGSIAVATSPVDPTYYQPRANAKARLAALAARLGPLRAALAPLTIAWPTADSRPAIRVASLELSSTATMKDQRTMSPETFTITAVIENVSTATITNVLATLHLRGDSGATIMGPAQVPITSLAADDGVLGAGADQVQLSFTVNVTAPLDHLGGWMLVLDLADATSMNPGFESQSELTVIETSASVADADNDGMSDAWERAEGLDPTMDDGALDHDGDGLSNLEEYRRGTRASVADTDNDGLSDGDEVLGTTTGVPTDPQREDTDLDGVADRLDKDPQDSTTSTTTHSRPEPVVRLDRCAISVSRGIHMRDPPAGDAVQVQNAGSSTLTWAVLGDTGPYVRVSPGFPNLGVGDGVLSVLSLGPAPPGDAPVELWVTDVGGAVHDRQRLLVYIGVPVPGPATCDVISPTPDGGSNPGADGGGMADSGALPGADGGMIAGHADGSTENPMSSGGCGCGTIQAQRGDWLVLSLAVGLAFRRRRATSARSSGGAAR
ncbi:MAG: hypothetical protein U1E65_07355 [Myxococcota bacterium]